MRRSIPTALAAIMLTLGPLVLWGSSIVRAQTTSSPVPATWGSIKAMYGESQAPQNAPSVPNPPEASERPYEPWTLPAAQAAIQKFGLSSWDILAVQRVVPFRNGMLLDDIEAVVTEKQWYYYRPSAGTITDTEPPGFALATEMDVYGSYLTIVTNSAYCWWQEWAVVFYMPICLTWDGNSFNEVVNAWAPTPFCNWACNGGLCASYQCGPAWPYSGKSDWYNFKSCSNNTSKKVGKIVQKRWLYTWNLCYGYSFNYIASTVRARIRY